jgi:hypothetical protein
MTSAMTYQSPVEEDIKKSKSFFGRFKKADGDKPVKEKKVKAPKVRAVVESTGEKKKKGLFGKTLKKPRAEFQAEINELKAQLNDTETKYDELKMWAKKAPVH